MTIALLACLALLGNNADSSEVVPAPLRRGLYFAYGIGPHLSSPTSFHRGGYTWSALMGFVFDAQFSVGVQVQTGDDAVPAGPNRPSGGQLAVGGAAIECTYAWTTTGRLRPFIGAGAGLMTLLAKPGGGGGGYNGSGCFLSIGIQYDLSESFSLAGALTPRWTRFFNPVGLDYPGVQFSPFVNRQLGISVRGLYYPNLLP